MPIKLITFGVGKPLNQGFAVLGASALNIQIFCWVWCIQTDWRILCAEWGTVIENVTQWYSEQCHSYAFNRGWSLKIIKSSEIFMTFRKEINRISGILYSLILGRQITVVSRTVKQLDDVLENFPTNSMSCRSCHAWGVDVDFLLIKLFFSFQIIKFIFFWGEARQLSSKSAYNVQITNTIH